MQAPTPALTPRATSLPPAEVTIVDLSAPAPTVAAGLKFGILAATFFMPFIGIGMGLYYWRQRDSADKVAVGKLWFATGVGLIGLYWALSDV